MRYIMYVAASGMAAQPEIPSLLAIIPEVGILQQVGYSVVSAPLAGEVFVLPPETGGVSFDDSTYAEPTILMRSVPTSSLKDEAFEE